MHATRHTIAARRNLPWGWYALPTIIAALVMSTLFTAGTGAAADATAAASATMADSETAHHALLLPASPQPGVGEPALNAREIAQSY